MCRLSHASKRFFSRSFATRIYLCARNVSRFGEREIRPRLTKRRAKTVISAHMCRANIGEVFFSPARPLTFRVNSVPSTRIWQVLHFAKNCLSISTVFLFPSGVETRMNVYCVYLMCVPNFQDFFHIRANFTRKSLIFNIFLFEDEVFTRLSIYCVINDDGNLQNDFARVGYMWRVECVLRQRVRNSKPKVRRHIKHVAPSTTQLHKAHFPKCSVIARAVFFFFRQCKNRDARGRETDLWEFSCSATD